MHLICEWGSDEGFLLHAILPDAERLKLHQSITIHQILDQIPKNVRTIWWHINLTKTERLISEFNKLNNILESKGITIVNGKVTDIGKKNVLALIKKEGGRVPVPEYGDWVIVKTNDNHSGVMDRRFDQNPVDTGIIGNEIIPFNPRRYPVLKYDSVPSHWLYRKDIVIQKYIANSASAFARAYFLGNSLVTSFAHSMDDIKRMSSYTGRRQLQHDTGSYNRRDIESDIVRQVLIAKNALKIDFGTADLVIDDFSRCWITDVNTTPYWGEDQFETITSALKNDALVLNIRNE